MLFKHISEAEFSTFLKSCLLKGSYFNFKKSKYTLKTPDQVHHQVSMRSMKNSTSDLFCNVNVHLGKLDVLSPNLSD